MYIKNAYVVLLVATCLILNGCSENLYESENDKSTTDNQSEASYNLTESKKINDNIVLEKDINSVQMPDKQLDIIPVKLKDFDFNEFGSMLFDNVKPDIEHEDTFTVYKYGDKQLYIYNGNIEYETNLSNYINEIVVTDNVSSNNIDAFTKKSLEFMTREQAIDKATDFLNKLNISYMKEPKVYALDMDTLQKEQNLYKKQIEKDDWLQEMQEKGKINLKSKWEKSDECYYLIFDASLENTKVYSDSYIIQESDGLNVDGSKIEIMISKDGIVYCNIGMIYEKSGSQIKQSKIISLDEMLNILSEKYSQIILESPITIKDISFEYCVVPTKIDRSSSGAIINQEFEMVPSWILNTVQTANARGETMTLNKNIIINAQTGEFIE